MNTPNKENIRLWVDALRSGKYQQTREVLARRGEYGTLSYCCLGVACEVALANGVELDVYQGTVHVLYDGAAVVLPDVVHKWLGVRDPSPVIDEDAINPRELAYLNDHGTSFEDIANLIEKEWLTERTEED